MINKLADDGTGEYLAHPKATNLALRSFSPHVREVVLGQIATALCLEAVDELPTYFLQEALVPARIGLRCELMERYEALGRPIFRKKLRIALSRYFRSFQYQQAIIQGVTRFDLDLQPVGLVTAGDRRWAMKHLSRMKKSRLATRLESFGDLESKVDSFDNLTISSTIL